MVVAMQVLTSLSASPKGTTPRKLQGRPDASLVRTSPPEPLNGTPQAKRLSFPGIGEGKSVNPTPGDAIVSRVPVLSANGIPLMPCNPAKARKLLESGKAVKKWSKLGIFYIQLKFNPSKPSYQPLAIGVDPGSKFEGFSVVGTEDTVLNIMSEAVDWVKKTLEQRRQMRRARRYRKTRMRECRSDNRLRNRDFLPPSTKARWDAKLRILAQLEKILPVSHVVVEDIKARTMKGSRALNKSFSPIETGKQYFYTELKKQGFDFTVKRGSDTQMLRKSFGLKKVKSKSKPIFETHCVDAWVLAASQTRASHPTTKSLYYLVSLRWHRRQLHRLEPDKRGIRRRYGGTMSLGLKKGTLVRHIKYGLCYTGGNLRYRFSLHSLKDGKRLTQNAKRKDFNILTRVAFRTQFLTTVNGVGFLGVI
jgi:hypothetical protein